MLLLGASAICELEWLQAYGLSLMAHKPLHYSAAVFMGFLVNLSTAFAIKVTGSLTFKVGASSGIHMCRCTAEVFEPEVLTVSFQLVRRHVKGPELIAVSAGGWLCEEYHAGVGGSSHGRCSHGDAALGLQRVSIWLRPIHL